MLTAVVGDSLFASTNVVVQAASPTEVARTGVYGTSIEVSPTETVFGLQSTALVIVKVRLAWPPTVTDPKSSPSLENWRCPGSAAEASIPMV